jgi:primase-polymerase (primpol)-like protein
MTRPVALAVLVAGIPESLRAERRWVVWRYDWDGKRWTKRPYQPRGVLAKSDDPTTWCSFDDVLAAYRSGRCDGIGFVLGDGWAGIDIDKCYPIGSSTVEAAQPFLNQLAAPCYSELSPSETGVKAIGRSSRIGGEIKFSTDPPTFTTWTGARFFAITGRGEGDPLADLSALIDEWFPQDTSPIILKPGEFTSALARDGYSLAAETTDDDLLLQMVGGDINSEAILALWRGDTSAYGNDHSRADLALCCHLAFWTNYDAERIDRMFRRSGLVRDKWTKGKSYRRATLKKALASGHVADVVMPGPDVKVKAADLDADWTGNF